MSADYSANSLDYMKLIHSLFEFLTNEILWSQTSNLKDLKHS